MISHGPRKDKTHYKTRYITVEEEDPSDGSDGPAQGDDLEQHPQVAHERHKRVLSVCEQKKQQTKTTRTRYQKFELSR
jgi:hypothetical protein